MKGSLTIEAALLLPVIILTLTLLMKESFSLYGQVRLTAEETQMDSLEPVDFFRKVQLLRQIGSQEGD